MRRDLPATLVLALTLVGCGATATSASPSASVGVTGTGPIATASSTPTSQSTAATTATTASAATAIDDCDTANVTLLHQAPDFEALLPASVADRPLAKWSVRGRCWLKLATGRSASEIDELLAEFETAEDPRPVDVSGLTYAVAGRSDTKADPPYFVFAAERAKTDKEIGLALLLMFAGADFLAPVTAGDLRAYEERTIADKQIYVGTVEMLGQGEHQRGRPFLYQNDDYMFMIISADDAWATEAIAQLP
jgi:hypothetical protein